MYILVTGGAGYIGSHVVKQLIENTEYDVAILDNFSTGHRETINVLQDMAMQSGNKKISIFEVDLKDLGAVEKVLESEKFDAIIHFAASIVVSESVQEPLKYYINNTVNTANLIQLANKYKIGKFIFSSTAAVYGEPEEIPIVETAVLTPINPYGMSKLMSEIILKDAALANKDFRYVILRYFNVAGADILNRIGESHQPETHLIPLIVQTALKKREKIIVFGDDYDTPDGTCIRDYVHVEDLANAHIASLEYLTSGKESNIFNCGYGHGFSVKEVIETVKKTSDENFKIEIASRRIGDPARLIADNTKITQILSWKPQYDDLEIICKTAFEWEKRTANC